jgi:bacillithiol biosynthesis cysteine-adding enzyme BshC
VTRVETVAPVGAARDPFAAAALRGEGPAAAFLPRVPRSAAEWREALARVAPRGVAAAAMGEALAARQRALGLGPAAEANARALAAGTALAVATGQQPGLLAGPLLSEHKAAGAIALARRAAEALGRAVVPVFWVASEDHDWNEVNRAAVIDRAGAVRTLSLDVAGDRRSVADVPVPREAADDLLRRLGEALPETDRAAAAVAAAAPPEGADLGTWFGVLLGRLLGDAGLVVVEPHVVAPWAGPVFARLVRDGERVQSSVRDAGARMRAAGLSSPLAPEPGTAPLFLRDALGGARRRVAFDGEAVTLRGERTALSRAALEDLVAREPLLASGDVVGRVIVQDAVLPVLALVGGPAELAYWAQARAAHEGAAGPFPVACPRPSATWVDARTAEAFASGGLALAEALEGAGEAAPRAGAPGPLAGRLARLRSELEAVATEGRDVPGLARSLREAEKDVLAAEAAAREHADRARGIDRDRLRRATTLLRPGGADQERVLSPVSLVARHGLEALREGLALLDPFAEGRQVVRLA